MSEGIAGSGLQVHAKVVTAQIVPLDSRHDGDIADGTVANLDATADDVVVVLAKA